MANHENRMTGKLIAMVLLASLVIAACGGSSPADQAKVVSTIQTGYRPDRVLSADGYIWVNDWAEGTVTVIDPTTMDVVNF